MAEHGDSAGHGGGDKKKGGLKGCLGNGCLRYLALFIVALVLLVSGVVASGLGLLHVPAPPGTQGSGITVNSKPIAHAPAAPAPAAPAAPAGNGPASTSRGGGPTLARATINGLPLPGTRGSMITPLTTAAFYIVEPADTLDTVAAKYSTTRDALYVYNSLSDPMLKIGQVVYLPPPEYAPVPNTGRNAGGTDNAPTDQGNPDASP
ncbi:MAG: LysM peptidoglycan-binding domain-containing protein [Chloroflexia bacterium]